MQRKRARETQAVTISVVIPVMNEEDAVPTLGGEVRVALDALDLCWECLWVDDGSTDGTAAAVEGLTATDCRHHLLRLDGNYGQSAALAAGFRAARGAIIGTLDGDGQNDPADFAAQLGRLGRGDVDMVNGVRTERRDGWNRRFSSRIANGVRNWLTGESVTDTGCAIRVFRRECVQEIPVWKGMHRFLPTLARIRGFRVTEMPVHHRPRETGRTKYGVGNRLGVGLADTLAVCWMKRRLVWPRVVSGSAEAGDVSDAGR